MRIAVTGSSGYIGSSFVDIVRAHGYQILHLTRSRPVSDEPWMYFDLAASESVDLPADVSVVVHLAFNPHTQTDVGAAQEIDSAKRLLASCQSIGARLVFVSSQTARADAPTAYGRTKWEIEQLVLAAQGVVVRPGQVYGGNEKGLFGMLVGVVAALPILPAFLPAPSIQPVHVDDLSEALLRSSLRRESSGRTYLIAQAQPLRFTAFLKSIAVDRLRVRRIFLPMPIIFIAWAGQLVGARLRTRLGLERLKSLFDLSVMASEASLLDLGLELRPLRMGMERHIDHRMGLQAEARAMLSYVLKESPEQVLICRYVDAIEQCRQARAMNLPSFVTRWPCLLALLDDRRFLTSERGGELAWRLDAATLLAEATPVGAVRFIDVGKRASMLRYGASLSYVVFMEVFWRLARAAVMPVFLRRVLDRCFP